MAPDLYKTMAGNITNTKASSAIGEIGFECATPMMQIDRVYKILFDGIVRIFNNIKSVFKNKKRLITALIASIIWILLMILPTFGINPKFVKWLSNFTFAQGGMSNEIPIIIGGILGKSIVATFYALLFLGGLKNVGKGLKRMFFSFKFDNLMQPVALLFGIGIALIIYNFMVGFAYIGYSIVGLSALILTLNSLGGGNGFIRRLVASITAKKINGQRTENSEMITSILSGVSIGFVLSVALSTIPFEYTPYYAGCAVLVVALILLIVLGKKHKKNRKEMTV